LLAGARGLRKAVKTADQLARVLRSIASRLCAATTIEPWPKKPLGGTGPERHCYLLEASTKQAAILAECCRPGSCNTIRRCGQQADV